MLSRDIETKDHKYYLDLRYIPCPGKQPGGNKMERRYKHHVRQRSNDLDDLHIQLTMCGQSLF